MSLLIGKIGDKHWSAVVTYRNTRIRLISIDELSNEQMGELHMLTYTLENALQKIDAEVEAMAVTLEEVHLGSESLDQQRVAENGAEYLAAARTLVE